MTVLGADVDQLDQLARHFHHEGDRLDAVVAAINGTVRRVYWAGSDADRFRAEWSGTMAPRVRSIADTLRDRCRDLADQARQQRQASEDGVGTGRGSGGGRFPTAVDTQPLPADRVTHSDFVQLDGQVGVGPVQVRVYGSYLIEQLANGQLRVTEIEGSAAGASADAGARAELDLGSTELRVGAMAGASALAGSQVGRTWEIPPDELDQLLVRLGMDQFGVPGIVRDGADAGTGLLDGVTPDSILGVDVPFDEVNDFVDRYVEYDLPDPVREGVDVTVSGDAYAMLGLTGGIASAEVEAELGIQIGAFQESDGDIGVRYAHQGSLSGDVDNPWGPLHGLFDPPSGSLEGSQAVEIIFDGEGRPSELAIEQTYGTGEHQTMQSVRVDLDSAEMRDDALAIRDAIANPTPENLGRLGGIDVGAWIDGGEVYEADLSVGGEDYGAGAGIGIPGLSASGDLTFEHQSVDYEYEGD